MLQNAFHFSKLILKQQPLHIVVFLFLFVYYTINIVLFQVPKSFFVLSLQAKCRFAQNIKVIFVHYFLILDRNNPFTHYSV